MTLTRRIHSDDLKAISAHFRKAGLTNFRIEFKDTISDATDIPSHWSSPCRPMALSAKDCDSGSETLRRDMTIPKDGEFWLDVQAAVNSEPPCYEPFWEPADWVRAEFSQGRLVKLV